MFHTYTAAFFIPTNKMIFYFFLFLASLSLVAVLAIRKHLLPLYIVWKILCIRLQNLRLKPRLVEFSEDQKELEFPDPIPCPAKGPSAEITRTLSPLVCRDLWGLYRASISQLCTENTPVKDCMPICGGILLENVLNYCCLGPDLWGEYLTAELLQQVQLPEARAFFSMQLFAESLHKECYEETLNAAQMGSNIKDWLREFCKNHSTGLKQSFLKHHFYQATHGMFGKLLALAAAQEFFMASVFIVIASECGAESVLALRYDKIQQERSDLCHCVVLLCGMLQRMPESQAHQIVFDAFLAEVARVEELLRGHEEASNLRNTLECSDDWPVVQQLRSKANVLLGDLGYGQLF